jgi:gluconolactonase
MSDATVTEIASGLRFPEGPVWLRDGSVLCVELQGRTVVRVRDGKVAVVAEPGGSPNGLAIGPDGAGYVCNSGGWGFQEVMGLTLPALEQPDDYSGGRIERIDLDTGAVQVLYTECDGHPLMGPNDLVFDEHGGMWFTDHGKMRARDRDHGGVYYAMPDGRSISEVIHPIDAPNGIGLSPDGGTLYVAETHTGRVLSWPVVAPGRVERTSPIGNGGHVVAGLPGFQLFDSLAVDGDGNVVVATLVTGALTVIAPGGEILDQVAVGDPFVTNVCFGGADLATAYITCSGTGRLVSAPWPRPGAPLAYSR